MVKTAVFDPNCTYKNSGTILQENGTTYQCTLHQTSIGKNANKFYIMHLVQLTSSSYVVWIRYGRVGNTGTIRTSSFTDKSGAIRFFSSQFKSKTGNSWPITSDRFVKKNGKYDLCDLDTGEESDEEDKGADEKEDEIVSVLDQAIQNLITLISDQTMIKNSVKSMNLDTEKMPLGKLSKTRINKAEKVLKALEKIFKDKKTVEEEEKVEDLSSQFYTLIPMNFGRSRPPLINKKALFEKFGDLLSVLRDVDIATTIVTKKKKGKDKIHPIDSVYQSLHTDIKHVTPDSDTYKWIQQYINNTHAPTHRYKVKLENVYEVVRDGESGKYINPGNNEMMLWHGSRLCNFVGILSQGLRLFPSAVRTGSMFGNGLYFADSFSKSANYTYWNRDNPIGCLFLCQVAVGNPKKLKRATYVTNLEKGYDSVKGVGKSCPDPTSETTVDGITVPCGKMGQTTEAGCSLLYNEYIIYNENQVKLRYLVQVRFC